MVTDDVKLGRAIYSVANAIGVMMSSQRDLDPEVYELVRRELAEARKHLAAVDRGKLAASESPEEAE